MNSYRFAQWLDSQPLKQRTRKDRVSAVLRVEQMYDIDLDRAYEGDRLAAILDTMRYSIRDQNDGRPNPSQINIYVGDIRTQLAWYRSHINSYLKFRAASHQN